MVMTYLQMILFCQMHADDTSEVRTLWYSSNCDIMTQTNSKTFQDFSALYIPQIMTYSSIVYRLQTRIRLKKPMNIKLPVLNIDAKTMLSFSTLHRLHHKKLLHQWLAVSG